jgi:20S proteasome alpha/beta subunit
MTPRLPYWPKAGRLVHMSQRMTLVVGAICAGAFVFCSDMEESTELGGKRSVHKLYTTLEPTWSMVLGTAGSGPLSEVAVRRLRGVAKHAAGKFIAKHEKIIETCLRDFYAQYIPFTLPEAKRQERNVALIIGIHDKKSGDKYLYRTYEEVPKPEHAFACAGVGQDIAYYFLDRLYDESLNEHESSSLLGFVMREAKESVGNVGRETGMVILHDDGVCNRSVIGQSFEARYPRLIDCFDKFWKK